MQIMEKKVTRDGAERIIGHGSHRVARSGTFKRVFSYSGTIVGSRIIYVIFLIVVIA